MAKKFDKKKISKTSWDGRSFVRYENELSACFPNHKTLLSTSNENLCELISRFRPFARKHADEQTLLQHPVDFLYFESSSYEDATFN